jgi:DNA-directed RNA polymerase specialized sigma24 family protein
MSVQDFARAEEVRPSGPAVPPELLSVPVTIRELRADPSFAPEGSRYNQLLKTILPLVEGTAARLLPEKPECVDDIARAVLKVFALRWRKLSRTTVIAAWLLRSTWFAAIRHRRSIGLPSPSKITNGAAPLLSFPIYSRLLRGIFKLPRRKRDALILLQVLGLPATGAARTLKTSPARVVKRAERGFKMLARSLRKIFSEEQTRAELARLVAEDSPETLVDEVSAAPIRTELVSATLRGWQWFAVKTVLKRIFRGVATTVGILLFLAGTVAWLAQRGVLTEWFLTQGNKELLKEFPELAAPARAWTPPGGNPPAPKHLADFLGETNIWPLKLTFSAAQWKAMQPSHIRPVGNMVQPDGTLILRNPNAKRSGLAGVLGLDFNWVAAQLDFDGQRFNKVAVRYRGNGTYLNSLYGPKQSLKVDLNKFVKGQHLAGTHTLNLVNSIPDNSYLHDALAEQLFREMGVPAPRTAYAYVTIDVAGKYHNLPLGLYVLIQNIDGDFAKEHFGSKSTPIFKPVTADLFNDLGTNWAAYSDTYEIKTKATLDQQQRVMEFARIVSHASDAEFAKALPDYLDIEEFAAFTAGHVLLSSYDGFLANGQNFYMYLDPDSNKFGFIPWDQDHAWGEFGYVGTTDQREHASIWEPAAYHFRFLERVFKVEEFREAYRRALERGLQSSFNEAKLFPRIDQMAALLRPCVAAESSFRLKRFDQAVSETWLPGARENGSPEGPKAPVHQIKRFITNRIPSVREQLDGKSYGMRVSRTR